MSPKVLTALLIAVLAASTAAADEPVAARLDAVLRVEAVDLPPKRAGRRELTYAFGKQDAAEAARQALVRVLGDRNLFEKVVAEGESDYVLHLVLESARSDFEDLTGWQSQPSPYEVSAEVAWSFRTGSGEVVAEGSLPGSGRVGVEAGLPRRQDAALAWARLLEDAAVRAFTEAYGAAAFGNEPPPEGGWISGSE